MRCKAECGKCDFIKIVEEDCPFVHGVKDTTGQLIETAKAKLSGGCTIRIYIEEGFAYVYIQKPDQSVHNFGIEKRLPIAEQLRLAVEKLSE